MRRLLLLGIAAIPFSLSSIHAQDKKAPPTIPDQDLAPWVDARVGERQPAASDRRIDEIGWAKDIRDALRLAKEHGRPVFLFTHDGRMTLGRC
jgi:hypothetical protein